LEAVKRTSNYQGRTNRSTANALVVVESLIDGKIDVGRFVAQEVRAASVPGVKISEQAMEFVDVCGLVVGRFGS
jgi:hypothetical protein